MSNKTQAIGFIDSATGSGRAVTQDNPLPVYQASQPSAAFTDRSGSIASGGVSQVVAAANASRRYLVFQNHSDTAMWLSIGAVAVAGQPSIYLAPNGGYFEPLVAPTEAIHVLCATTGKEFTCKEA